MALTKAVKYLDKSKISYPTICLRIANNKRVMRSYVLLANQREFRYSERTGYAYLQLKQRKSQSPLIFQFR